MTCIPKDVDKREDKSWKANWCSHYGKQYGSSSKKKKKKIVLSYDPEIPPLGIYPKELKSRS